MPSGDGCERGSQCSRVLAVVVVAAVVAVQGRFFVDLSQQAIKNSPRWDAAAPINREYEARLYDYYGRPVYWGSGDRPLETPTPHEHPGHHTR